MQMDRAYAERSNGTWEVWTYSEGRRVYLTKGSAAQIESWCRKHHFNLQYVEKVPCEGSRSR